MKKSQQAGGLRLLMLSCLFSALVLMPACRKGPEEAVSFEPAKPRPGASVLVSFRPRGSLLEKSEEVSLSAYFYVKGMPEVLTLPMSKKGSVWEATLNPKPDCRGAVLKFTSGDILETNDRKGYVLALYDDRGDLVAGHRAGLAEALASWGNYYAGLDSDKARALKLFEEDFAQYPRIKADYLSPYFTLLPRMRMKEGQDLILKDLAELSAKPDPTPDELKILITWYTRLQMPGLAERFITALKEKEPRGEMVQAERFRAFHGEKDIRKKLSMLEAFRRDFPDRKLLSQFHFFMVAAFRDAELYVEARDFLEAHPFPGSWQLTINLAWTMVQRGADMTLAEKLAARGVELARRERDDSQKARPAYLTPREWVEQKNASVGEALDALGFIQLRLLKTDQALHSLKEAAGLLKEKNRQVNEHYAEAMAKAAAPAEALAEVERLLRARRDTPRMKELLKETYLAARGGGGGYAEFLAAVEEAARQLLRDELHKQLRKDPAPEFSLPDLQGGIVSLKDLKGKVVVLEFWATWCNPCLSAFPGWRRAVEKFQSRDDVRFLFINAWERVTDRRKIASDFLASSGYSFQVLLDSRDEVIDAYRVNGIPTHFVIDGRGRVRFRTEGFFGDTDGLVEELSMKIELAR